MFGQQKFDIENYSKNRKLPKEFSKYMTITKRIITIENRQRTVIRQNSRRTVWCEFCEAQSETISPEQAAIILDTSLPKIYRGIENGSLHFINSENQSPSICIISLKIQKQR